MRLRNVKTAADRAFRKELRTHEQKLISKRQRVIGLVLIVLGVLILSVGLFGWLAGDMQLAAFATLTDQVYAARETAQSAGTKVTGAFDLDGDNSGMRVFYAEYSAGAETGYVNAQEFKIEENKKSLKGEGLQFPGTKDFPNLVVAEEETVKLDNGMEFTQSVKLRGAGSSKYRSLKLTVEEPGTLSVWALSSLADQERRMVLYNTKGTEVAEGMASAKAEGALSAVTFAIPEGGTFYLSAKGDLPIAPMSAIMNVAIILLLIGVMLLFNGIMMRVQRWERMKDLFFVEPVILFFLLFVYYPLIDLVRISFTDMGILTTGKQEFIGWGNYNWLFNQSGAKYFWESLRITGVYTFWEITITVVGGMLLALLFNRMTRTFNAFRAIVFMPKYIAVSTSAVVFMWILYAPMAGGAGAQNDGILNFALSRFGIQGPRWLIDEATALTGVLILTAWRVVGYAMMIYLSAMQGIPKDYYEAASIDAADGVQQFRYITMPLLAPTTLFLFVTTFIASMKVFQSVDVMTGGGPGTSTNVMVQWIYNLTFKDFRTARGAAVSLVFFLILLVCTAATMKYSNKSVNYDS